MVDSGFPGQHATRTTVQTTSTTVETSVRYDPSYFKTLPGIIKVARLVFDLVGFICIECSGIYQYHSRGSFFNGVAMTGFWYTVILLIFYIFHIVEKTYKIPWALVELIFCGAWALLYLIAASLAVDLGLSTYIAAGIFGFLSMIAYGFDAFLKFNIYKSGQLAQGERVINKQTTTAFSSA